jgi:putative transposase
VGAGRHAGQRARSRRGRLALAAFRAVVKFPKIIWADQAYRALVDWALVQWLCVMRIVTRPTGKFQIQPKRWIVERTFGWLNRSRRLAKSCVPWVT